MAAMLKPPPAKPIREAPVLPPLPDPMDADADMSRAAREKRAALRQAHPEAWRAQLAGLWHFDPDYSYEPFHEYGGEATTDPDYPNHSLHLTEFDANGDNLPVDLRAYALQGQGQDTLTAAAAGLAVDFELGVRLAPDAIARAGRTFGRPFPPNKLVTPDLLVTPQLTPAEEARFVSADPDVWRMDRGAPAPRMALEVLSEGNVDNDLEVKVHLYAAMGVPEYFVCDLGDKRWKGSPRELLLFRLGEDLTGVFPGRIGQVFRPCREVAGRWGAVCGPETGGIGLPVRVSGVGIGNRIGIRAGAVGPRAGAASEGGGGLWNVGAGVRRRGATGSAGRRCGRGPARG